MNLRFTSYLDSLPCVPSGRSHGSASAPLLRFKFRVGASFVEPIAATGIYRIVTIPPQLRGGAHK